MRDRYQDSPGETRDVSVRRLGRLTWRATQLGTLATVGFAVVFARNAPAAQTTSVQHPPTARPAASATPSSQHTVTRAHVTSSPTQKPAAAAAQPSAPAAQQAAPTTVATTPQLAPPTTPPAPVPTTAAPAPTTTSSASHGGG